MMLIQLTRLVGLRYRFLHVLSKCQFFTMLLIFITITVGFLFLALCLHIDRILGWQSFRLAMPGYSVIFLLSAWKLLHESCWLSSTARFLNRLLDSCGAVAIQRLKTVNPSPIHCPPPTENYPRKSVCIHTIHTQSQVSVPYSNHEHPACTIKLRKNKSIT